MKNKTTMREPYPPQLLTMEEAAEFHRIASEAGRKAYYETYNRLVLMKGCGTPEVTERDLEAARFVQEH